MAKEILTRVWCDLCLGEDDSREEATHRDNAVTLGLGRGARPLSLDLCERHYKELLEPLVEALSGYGAPVGDAPAIRSPRAKSTPSSQSAAPEAGPFRCQFPDCDALLKNAGSFNAHVRQQHGMTRGVYVETYGEPQVEAEREALPVISNPIGEDRAVCEVCGKIYSHELGNNRPTQALGVHLARAHGIRSEKTAAKTS